MSTFVVRTPSTELLLVDLSSLPSRELEPFWSAELSVWREELDWDVGAALCSMRRAVERGNVLGKAVRKGRSTVGYSHYLVEGRRGVISAFHAAPSEPLPERARIAQRLLRGVIEDLEARGARRIETQLVSREAPEHVPSFESLGFETFWRSFARLPLSRCALELPFAPAVSLLAFKAWNLSEVAALMHRAHVGGCDAAMNELYRSAAGCRLLLENVVRQRGCGTPVSHASTVARLSTTDDAVGFTLVSETARRRAHLAQLAVAPEAQGNGLGRTLIEHAVARLAARGFETLSLMVSDGNRRASDLYRSLGFETRFRFPVFSREHAGRSG